jgi:hypothetical protein
MYQTRVETADEVSKKFDKCFTQDIGAMNRGVISDSSFIVSFKRRPMKKRGNTKKCKEVRSKDIRWKKRQPQKMQRGSFKRPPMKKEPPHKMQRGLFKRHLMKKEAPRKTQRGSFKMSDEKRGAPQNAKGLVQKTSDEKRGTLKNAKGLLQKATVWNQNCTKPIPQRNRTKVVPQRNRTKVVPQRNRMKPIPQQKSHEGDTTTKSHEGDSTTKSHKCDIAMKSHEDIITKQNRVKTPPLDKQWSSNSLWSLSGSFFTIYSIWISAYKIDSQSLGPIPVEGEYHLSTKDLCIRGEIAPGAANKIHTTSLLADPPLCLFDLILDVPATSVNESLSPSCLEHLLVFPIDTANLFSRIKALRACTIELSLHGGSSNLSMSGHNSPMLGLESLQVATTTSAASKLAPEEKMDKL